MTRLVVLLAVLSLAAAPPAVLTPEQVKLLRQRDELFTQAQEEWNAGRQAEAMAAMSRVQTLTEQVCGPMAGQACFGRTWLANWLEARGEWKEVVAQRERLWHIQSALWGKEHYKAVDARWEAHTARLRVGWTKAQNEQWDRAFSLNEEVFRLWQMGQSARALPLAKEALALRRSLVGEKHPWVALALYNLAAQHKAMGEYKVALTLDRQSLKVYEEVLGRRHPNYANSLNNLAILHNAMGDHKAALTLCQEALKLREELLGRRHPSYATSLNSLALFTEMLGDHKAALHLYQQAVKLREELHGRRHADYITCLNNLGGLHFRMGDHKTALTLLKQALKLTGQVEGVRHHHYAMSLSNLATVHRAIGDYKDALRLMQQALKVNEEALGRRHPLYALTLNNLVGVYLDLRDDKAALPLSEQALVIVADHLRDNAVVQSDRQQFAAVQAVRGFLDARLLLPEDSKHASAADHVLAWKGQVLLRQQQRRLFLRLTTDKDARDAAARLEVVTRLLAALRLSGTATREKRQALEKEQDDAQEALSRLSTDFRAAQAKERITPEDLAKALPEGAVLVDYLFHGKWLTAFIHRRGQPHVRIYLGNAAPVVKAIADWRPLLVSGRGNGMVAAALKRLVWAPLEKHLEGAKVVLVSPDGPLGMVPFAALPGRKSGSYLIEDVALAVVPVPSAIPEMLAVKKDRLAPTLLTVGDLRYDPTEKAIIPLASTDDRAAARTGREKFGRLPATALEALAVRSSFEKLFKGGTVTTLGEGDATKAAVRKALSSVRYAHLATHGWFAPETVKSALAPDKGRLDERREVTGWHPLLLSGLALSDANRDPGPGEEDGILTALEVSEMDLSRLELAVLSACETGLGAVAGGEGLLGMQRAFQVAGARTVIASLWKVDDRATQALMADFYAKTWDTKTILGRAEALRQAQLTMLRDGVKRGIAKKAEKVPDGPKTTRLPPAYWAAFVLSGDWR